MNPTGFSPLANHLWQSTLFAACAALLTLALRRDRARVRHGVWVAASCKFLIPFSMLIAWGGHVRWRAAPPAVPAGLSIVVDRVGAPFTSALAGAPSPARVRAARSELPEVLTVIWVCGFLGIASNWLVRWRQLAADVRAATPLPLDLPVRAMSSATLHEPGVFGIFRPILLLPEGIADRLTPAQLRAVVAHEMAHVRHRDNLIALLHMFVETVFWFHPLVWWIGRRMVVERERACDEEVLRLGNEPRAYAEGILQVCRMYLESPLQCVSGITGADLNRRIHAIVAGQKGSDLHFAKKAALTAAGIGALAIPLSIGMLEAPRIQAQVSAAVAPQFEVASVRLCKDEPTRMRAAGNSSPGRLSTGCDVLVDADNSLGFIQRAYIRFAGGHTNPLGVLAIQGGPAWIHSEMYEINARAVGSPSLEMMQGPMLQALLEDRFKLKIHRETREGPVYALTLAGGVSKLNPFIAGSCVQMPLTFPVPALPAGQRYCRDLVSLQNPAVEAEGSTLTDFAKLLNLVLDRPVIDRTGLRSRFNIHVEFARDEATPGLRQPVPDAPAAASEPAAPTIFTAVREQLGLKLEPARGPIEFLVIDHVERPSVN